jgi:SAM-dependent methyltransferase
MGNEANIDEMIAFGKVLIEKGRTTEQIIKQLSYVDSEILRELYKIPRQNIIDFLNDYFQVSELILPFLDLGCGDQRYVPQIIKEMFGERNYVGLDHKQDNEIKFGTLIRGDANNLPFKNHSFGTILCSEVLEHIEDPGRVLSEVARVIKPRGIFILTLPGADIPRHDKPPFQTDYRRFSHIDVRNLLKEKFTIEDFSTRVFSGLEVNILVSARKKR